MLHAGVCIQICRVHVNMSHDGLRTHRTHTTYSWTYTSSSKGQFGTGTGWYPECRSPVQIYIYMLISRTTYRCGYLWDGKENQSTCQINHKLGQSGQIWSCVIMTDKPCLSRCVWVFTGAMFMFDYPPPTSMLHLIVEFGACKYPKVYPVWFMHTRGTVVITTPDCWSSGRGIPHSKVASCLKAGSISQAW
jgi:hypothetical protein